MFSLAALSALAIWAALGPDWRLYSLTRHIPLAGKFRCSIRYLALVEFAIAALAAIGLAEAVEQARESIRRACRWWAFAGVALVGIAVPIGLLTGGPFGRWLHRVMHEWSVPATKSR